MTPAEAEVLGARTLAAIEDYARHANYVQLVAADRERVAADLAGLQECHAGGGPWVEEENHAGRYAEGLRRTAALYGVAP